VRRRKAPARRRKAAPKKRAVRKFGVKLASGFYPKTTKVAVLYKTPWHNNTADGSWTYSNALQFGLNGLWRPTVFCDNEAAGNRNESPPNIYNMGAAAGGGLLGSAASGSPYRQYRVSKCHVALELLNMSADPIQVCGSVDTDFAAWPPSIHGTNPTAVNQRVGMVDVMLPIRGGQNKPLVIKRTFDIAKISGLTKAQWLAERGEGDSFAVPINGVGSGTQHGGAGTATENPVNYAIWNLSASKISGAMADDEWCWRATMKWEVVLFTRNDEIVTTNTPELELKSDEPVVVDPPKTGPPSAAAAPDPAPLPIPATKKVTLASSLKKPR